MNGTIFEVVVIGAGPAGLMCSYYLKHLGLEHIIFDQGHVGETWRAQRWDNFRMITPFQSSLPPGALLKTRLPDAFGSASDMVAILQEYTASFQLPVKEQARVLSVDKPPGSPVFQVQVLDDNETVRSYDAWQVIVAVGASNRSRIPPVASSLPASVEQLHSSSFKNADQLTAGAVLVVGGGQSGMEITHELIAHGRAVWWSSTPRIELPRYYRGKELSKWLMEAGLPDVGEVRDGEHPVTTYALDEDKVLDRATLASMGARMTGRLEGISGSKLTFASLSDADLKTATSASATLLAAIDNYITRENIDAPGSCVTGRVSAVEAMELDIIREGISAIIWATGFNDSLDTIQWPSGTDMRASERGLTSLDGLYVVGGSAAGRDYVVAAKDEASHVTNRIYGILR